MDWQVHRIKGATQRRRKYQKKIRNVLACTQDKRSLSEKKKISEKIKVREPEPWTNEALGT